MTRVQLRRRAVRFAILAAVVLFLGTTGLGFGLGLSFILSSLFGSF